MNSVFIDAFGYDGHYIIGEIVFKKLSENVRQKINQCNYLESFNNSMGHASVWADRIKRNPYYRWTSKLHYFDVDNDPPLTCGKVFYPDKDQPEHNLIAGIENFTSTLQHDGFCRKDTPIDFLMSLHLMQDLHQPLHLTGKDRGGNERKFIIDGKLYNLHQFWDSDILHLFRIKKHLTTMEKTIEYFSKMVDKEMYHRDVKCPVNFSIQTIVEWANEISKENCNLLWNFNDEKYIEKSRILLKKMILLSIYRSVCFFEHVLKKHENINYANRNHKSKSLL